MLTIHVDVHRNTQLLKIKFAYLCTIWNCLMFQPWHVYQIPENPDPSVPNSFSQQPLSGRVIISLHLTNKETEYQSHSPKVTQPASWGIQVPWLLIPTSPRFPEKHSCPVSSSSMLPWVSSSDFGPMLCWGLPSGGSPVAFHFFLCLKIHFFAGFDAVIQSPGIFPYNSGLWVNLEGTKTRDPEQAGKFA